MGLSGVNCPRVSPYVRLSHLLGGQVQSLIASLPSSIEYVKAGKVRGLAVTSAKRPETLPDLPAAGELVAGYEVSSWYGIGVPRNTPTDVVEKLNREVNADAPQAPRQWRGLRRRVASRSRHARREQAHEVVRLEARFNDGFGWPAESWRRWRKVSNMMFEQTKGERRGVAPFLF